MTNSPIPGDVVAQIDRVLDIPRETTQQTINWSRPALHALLSAHSYIEALQRELAARDDTISLLESNARVQATLLADTGRKLTEKTELLSDFVDQLDENDPYHALSGYLGQARGERDTARSQASSARRLALEALPMSIYRVEEDEDTVRLSIGGTRITAWSIYTDEGMALLKLDAAIRDIKGET